MELKRFPAVILALAIALSGVFVTLADTTTFTIIILQGALTLTPAAPISLTGVTLSNIGPNQQSAGAGTWIVEDSTGTGAGWHLMMEGGDFVNGNGKKIAVSGFRANPQSPMWISGQSDPMPVPGSAGFLSTTLTVLTANQNEGMGTYSQVISLTLDIPAGSYAGAYTGTITSTLTSGP